MTRHAQALVLALALALTASPHAHAQVQGYYRYPAIAGDHVVFTAEGDLWTAPIAGGLARRITTAQGEESHARVSPDGKTLAFSASYEGPTEVYTMPIEGGLPARRTYDGTNATVVSWTPDGKILYATNRYSTLPQAQLVTIDGAGIAQRVPLAQAADASIAGDGTIYFTRLPFQGSHTKRYRGGTAQSLWKWRPGMPEAKALTAAYAGTSKDPMVWDGRLYFASDRQANDSLPGVVNIWSSDPDGGDLRQLTHYTDFDVQDPSLADGRIVFQQGADLWLLDLRAGGSPHRLDIRLSTDLDQMREHWVTKPMDFFTSAHLSADGARVALVSRGRVFVAPADQGRFVLATPETPDRFIRYRDARFLPGSDRLVTLSDESGEIEVWTVAENGIGARQQLTKDADILRWDAIPSPDGKRIAHHDKNQRLWIYDVASGKNHRIATSMYEGSWISSAPGFSDLAWSADSRWLAYNDVAPNMMGRIALYDTKSGSTTFVTTDRYDSYSAAWTPDGQWLYFLSDRELRSDVGSPWGMHAPDPHFVKSTRIYAVSLRPGAKWPFRAKTELDVADTSKAKPPMPEPADVAGAVTRLFEVPVPAGDYRGLTTDGARLYWLERAEGGGGGGRGGATLKTLELGREAKPQTFAEGIASFELSADGKKILLRKGQDLYVVKAGAKAPTKLDDSKVDLSGWSFAVDPRAEFREMFDDAWRLERDYFHDPDMNGVDWPAMRTKYAPLAARAMDRAELADVIAQMVAELSTLHTFVRGGDVRRADETVQPASLGARLVRDEEAGGWRVDHIYRSDPDIPDELSPLARPGVDVHEGDVITAINGTPLTRVTDPAQLLRNQAGKQVLLRVGTDGQARDVVVTAISQGRESDLRYDEWEYTRRLETDSLSDQRVGYVHLRAMGSGDIAQWIRDYYPVFNRRGLIIDVRNNRGGNIDSWILGRLLRRAWSQWHPRVGEPYWNMQYAFRGPIIVLVNERTSSDGEAFAEGFKRLGLGKVLGTRTWGGEVWLSSSNFLVDRGIATAAEQGVYGPQGDMLIEGWGVEPDIVVDNLPVETWKGRDRQLEEAVKLLLGGS